jgi:hypothetical protein
MNGIILPNPYPPLIAHRILLLSDVSEICSFSNFFFWVAKTWSSDDFVDISFSFIPVNLETFSQVALSVPLDGAIIVILKLRNEEEKALNVKRNKHIKNLRFKSTQYSDRIFTISYNII